jgi:DNA-binding MarR family transcriptional regulator
MGPTNTLSYLIQHLSAVISKQSDQVLQEQLGIGLSQYRILMVLEDNEFGMAGPGSDGTGNLANPRLQQKSIASSLGQTEASISRQIKLLATKGLLVSKRHPHNRRQHLTALTPLGRQVTEAASNILRRDFGPRFAQLGEDHLLRLITSLQKLHALTCHPGTPGACDHPMSL